MIEWIPEGPLVRHYAGVKGGTTMRGPKGLRICTWHTTESPITRDALVMARYLSSVGADTTIVLNISTGQVVQMLPFSSGARTLQDGDWPLDPTNTWGEVHVQIEVIGYASTPWTSQITPAGKAGLKIVMDALRELEIPNRWCHGIRPPVYPGPGVAKKIQPTESGHFHHAGWVDNNHGDPGAIADPWAIEEREIVPTPLLEYPARASIPTANFWRDLEAVIRSEGFDVYCGRSHYDKGWCRPGKHGHGKTSLHFEGLALDFGRDYETAVSAREKIYNSAKIKMLRDYYGSQMGWVHDRGPNDHDDHGHVQARPNQTNGKLWDNTLAGVTMYGDRGQAVRSWQASLKDTGENITVDGSYGLETFWATRRWQSSRGLKVDAIIGAGSRAEMARHLIQLEAEKIGGGIIDLTQYAQALLDLGYTANESGVRAFQKDEGLAEDGIVGPITSKALEDKMSEVLNAVKALATKVDRMDTLDVHSSTADFLATGHKGAQPRGWFLDLVGRRVGRIDRMTHGLKDLVVAQAADQAGAVAGLQEAVNQLAGKVSGGIDLEAVAAASQRGAEAAFAKAKVSTELTFADDDDEEPVA